MSVASHLLPFLFCLAGFVALATAMVRPQETLFGHALAHMSIVVLRSAGAGLLLLALGWLAHGRGWGMGLVIYSGYTSLAAGLVFFALLVFARLK